MKELFSTLLRWGFEKEKVMGKAREREQEKRNGRRETEKERFSNWLKYVRFGVGFI